MCWCKKYRAWQRALAEEQRRDADRRALIARQDRDINLDQED